MKSLKQLRKDSGKSQEEIAVLVKKSKQTIQNWENSMTQPNAKCCQILADEFGISVDDMIKTVFPENQE